MSKSQEVYEKVEALVASGVRKADAFRQVADEYGQPFNSMRGAYYAHIRPDGGVSTRSRGPKRNTAEAAIESAVIALNRAIAGIDAELETAKQRIEQAKTDYEQLKETAPERKAQIQTKIEVLSN